MGAMVLLRHELPDGSAHFDWLLQRDDNRQGLLTFRLFERPDLAAETVLNGQRLPDHREVYLTYEGPISGAPGPSRSRGHPVDNRGTVRRIAAGDCRVLRETGDLVEFAARFRSAPERLWRATAPDAGTWSFALVDSLSGAILKGGAASSSPRDSGAGSGARRLS